MFNDSSDHYWYYALTTSDNENSGMIDLFFYSKDYEFYTKRGNNANEGIALALDDNYIMVKFFDKEVYDPSDKITAIVSSNGTIFSSTGGSEIGEGYSQSEKKTYDEFWKDKKESKIESNEFFDGGGISYNRSYVRKYCSQTQTLQEKA